MDKKVKWETTQQLLTASYAVGNAWHIKDFVLLRKNRTPGWPPKVILLILPSESLGWTPKVSP